jgi:hypothetical protein
MIGSPDGPHVLKGGRPTGSTAHSAYAHTDINPNLHCMCTNAARSLHHRLHCSYSASLTRGTLQRNGVATRTKLSELPPPKQGTSRIPRCPRQTSSLNISPVLVLPFIASPPLSRTGNGPSTHLESCPVILNRTCAPLLRAHNILGPLPLVKSPPLHITPHPPPPPDITSPRAPVVHIPLQRT